jgi:RNA polymerase sigma-70 factor (ECF subfamily)
VTDASKVIARVYREEWAPVVATLARRLRDLDIAEEMAAEAFATAVERWPVDGVPPNPGAWLATTAYRKAIDRLRREVRREEKHKEALVLSDPPEPLGAIDDDRLRLIFTCCHPALAMESRVALTLRMVGGLTVPEIARAFLVREDAMGRRITRAKAKIKAARIPYGVPFREDLPARVTGVLTVLYLIFNEGYLASDPGKEAIRGELTAEAIRLTRLVRDLMPDDGEVAGLLALMLLTEARRPARVSASGELVTLAEQDRSAWDRELIAEGHALVRARASPPGRRLGVSRSSPRSTPSTPTPGTSVTPTGRRSSRSTTSCFASTPRRSCGSTGRSRSPSSTVRRSPSRRWTVCRWRATTPSTPPARSCCAGWAAARSRGRRTTGLSRSPATPRRRRTSSVAVMSWAQRARRAE